MTVVIAPQPGPQTSFAATPADLGFFGGQAGGGKTFSLLLEPLRHYHNGKFGCVIFRRNTVQIRNEGGLWDSSIDLYSKFLGTPKDSTLEWVFPSKMKVKFSHLEYEKDVLGYQGSQIPFIGFDEVTHFTRKQFFYMVSRLRSDSGVSGYIRATCNPDADSWVKVFLQWWIDEATGLAIPERAGVLRYFVMIEDDLHWGDSKQELIDRFGEDVGKFAMSVTFIPSKVTDNKILLEKDPSYLAKLNALPRVERLRLLGGNWNVRASAGMFFQRNWFEIVDALPSDAVDTVRYWERAATKPNEKNPDPDYTAGLKMTKHRSGVYCVTDVRRFREGPLAVERAVKNAAMQDGRGVRIVLEQDPGSAGVSEVQNFVRMLAGFDVAVNKVTDSKDARARPVSAQSEAGNIKLLRGSWNEAFLNELENFPESKHDDQVDVFSGAFNALTEKQVGAWTHEMITTRAASDSAASVTQW